MHTHTHKLKQTSLVIMLTYMYMSLNEHFRNGLNHFLREDHAFIHVGVYECDFLREKVTASLEQYVTALTQAFLIGCVGTLDIKF